MDRCNEEEEVQSTVNKKFRTNAEGVQSQARMQGLFEIHFDWTYSVFLYDVTWVGFVWIRFRYSFDETL